MKVLMTADAVGGVWTYAMELIGALDRRDVQVVLATMGAPLSPPQRSDVRRLPNAHVVESRYRLEWMEEPWSDVDRATEWLLRLEADEAPDLVHLNDLVRGHAGWRVPRLVTVHSCVLSWWRAVHGRPPDGMAEYRTRVRDSLRAADVVVAPTAAMLRAAEREYGRLERRRVIPNARDPRLFPTGPKESFIFGAGRVWDEAKGLATLDAATARLEWPVFVAGPRRYADGRRLHFRHARLLGTLEPPALARWMAAAPICALPARYEPFGLTALEAALAGCALVLGDIPSLRELWEDAAEFVPPGDVDALAAALRTLMETPERRAELAERSRLRAYDFAPSVQAEAYAQLYSELAAGDRSGGEATACVS
jgi:glycogen synthase